MVNDTGGKRQRQTGPTDEEGRLLCGATEELIKYVLEKTGEPHEFISLSEKNIQPCRGCVCCAGDNRCVIEDDWAEIRDKMYEADAVVFGAPNYYGSINSLGHAFLERTFSLRHTERPKWWPTASARLSGRKNS